MLYEFLRLTIFSLILSSSLLGIVRTDKNFPIKQLEPRKTVQDGSALTLGNKMGVDSLSSDGFAQEIKSTNNLNYITD